MTVGIVVPVYNRRENLALMLASLERQTSDDFVVVVADDGSDDGTGELVAGLAAAEVWAGRLRWISCGPHRDVRIGRARNLGAANLPAGVSLMVMLDSDVLVQPGAVAAYAAAHAAHPGALIVGPVEWLPELGRDELAAAVAGRAGGLAGLRDKIPATSTAAIPVPIPVQVQGTLVGPELRFSLFGGLGEVDPDQPRDFRPYWMVPLNTGWPVGLFWSLGGFREDLPGYAVADFAMGVAAAAAGIQCISRPDLWALHMWHPKAPAPAPAAAFDVEAEVDRHGMPAALFLMARGTAA